MDKLEFRDKLKQAVAEGKTSVVNEMYQSLNRSEKPGFVGNALRKVILNFSEELDEYGYRVDFPAVPQSWFYCNFYRPNNIRAAQIGIPATSDGTLGVHCHVSATNASFTNGYEDVLALSWEEFIGYEMLQAFIEKFIISLVRALPYTPQEIQDGPVVF